VRAPFPYLFPRHAYRDATPMLMDLCCDFRYDLKQGTPCGWSVFAELTQMFGSTEISKSPVSKVPIELAKHEAAQHKVSREMKRKRDGEETEGFFNPKE
jgi:hypothetical protein